MDEIKFTPIGVMKMGNKQKAKEYKSLVLFARKCLIIGLPVAYVAGLVCGLLL